MKDKAKNYVVSKLRLPLNLQMFADEPPGQGGEPGAGGDGGSGGQPAGGSAGGDEPPAITLEAVQSFLNADEKGKSWLNSFADTRVTEAIKTYETKTLPKKVQYEIAKRYPPETPEQKQMRELKEQLDQIQRDKQMSDMRNFALTEAGKLGVPSDLVGYLLGENEDATKTNLQTVKSVIDTQVESMVNERLKRSSRDPKDPTPPGDALTLEKLKSMSTAEVAELDPAEVDRVLSGK
ncbi:hypothetical protein CHH71_12220 [Shouchella clausii]|nr:hypothetical protein CHH71_12220 [Shouchella clausii]